MPRPVKKYSKTDLEKDYIIDAIEDESRNGLAFDDETIEVLKKITVADLFLIQKAFYQAYKAGIKSVEE